MRKFLNKLKERDGLWRAPLEKGEGETAMRVSWHDKSTKEFQLGWKDPR